MQDIYTLDCESSGLSEHSYPISIGVAGPDGQAWSWLICPLEDWDYWDEFAEDIHNIQRSELIEKGRDPYLVCKEMNAVLADKAMIVDSPWDQFWVKRLFQDTGIKMCFSVKHVQDVLDHDKTDALFDRIETYAFSHNALEDAQALRSMITEAMDHA